MTEHITIKKMRNRANANRLKERYKREYLNRFAGKVVYIPVSELHKYTHFFLENGLWSIYDFMGDKMGDNSCS